MDINIDKKSFIRENISFVIYQIKYEYKQKNTFAVNYSHFLSKLTLACTLIKYYTNSNQNMVPDSYLTLCHYISLIFELILPHVVRLFPSHFTKQGHFWIHSQPENRRFSTNTGKTQTNKHESHSPINSNQKKNNINK